MNSLIPDEPADKDKLCAAIKTELDRIAKLKSEIQAAQLDSWRRMLGPQLDEGLCSRGAAERLMTHDDPQVRKGTLTLLAHYWKPDPAHEHVFRTIALSDPDSEMRATAISCLIALHSGNSDKAVATFLATFVSDECNSFALRAVAYLGLLQVQGIAIPAELMGRLAMGSDKLPEVVDWGLVTSFL